MATANVFELLPLRQENKEVSRKAYSRFKNIINEGISPCPWADYLKCIPQTIKSVDDTLHDSRLFMSGTRDIPENQSGGYKKEGYKKKGYKGGAGVDSFIASLDSTISLGRNVQQQVDKAYDDLQTERMKAAAAIAYISRLFALGMEADVDELRDYARDAHTMELDSVMYKLVSYIKNTRHT